MNRRVKRRLVSIALYLLTIKTWLYDAATGDLDRSRGAGGVDCILHVRAQERKADRLSRHDDRVNKTRVTNASDYYNVVVAMIFPSVNRGAAIFHENNYRFAGN